LLWRDFIPPESATSHHPLLHEHEIFFTVYQQKLAQILLFSWIILTAMALAVIGATTSVIALADFANSVVEHLYNAYKAYGSAPRSMIDFAEQIGSCLAQINYFQHNVDSSDLALPPYFIKVVDDHIDRVRGVFYSEVDV
jgi:hypothetical protein